MKLEKIHTCSRIFRLVFLATTGIMAVAVTIMTLNMTDVRTLTLIPVISSPITAPTAITTRRIATRAKGPTSAFIRSPVRLLQSEAARPRTFHALNAVDAGQGSMYDTGEALVALLSVLLIDGIETLQVVSEITSHFLHGLWNLFRLYHQAEFLETLEDRAVRPGVADILVRFASGDDATTQPHHGLHREK